MKRLQSRKDCKGYTLMKQLLINLELESSDYNWLITDIEAYPQSKEIFEIINNKEYIILSTKELMNILKIEDFQWIWAVFSAIPSKYSTDEILKYELPYIQPIDKDYDPFGENPKIQHPLAEFEIGAWDSSGMFIVTNDEKILEKFKENYPLSKETFNGIAIFDDWDFRPTSLMKNRKKDYIICLIPIIILFIASVIATIFEWYLCIFIILSLLALISIWLEWLKLKNNHLQITKDTIYITNRFNKIKEYVVDYKECKLELKESVKRGGGIWLRFLDKNNKLICKYEDMINSPTMYGGKLLPWGQALKSLGITIIDKNEIFNRW